MWSKEGKVERKGLKGAGGREDEVMGLRPARFRQSISAIIIK